MKNRGLVLPTTLLFVLIAFFVASSLLIRGHGEAQATVLDLESIQKESLARSAMASTVAILNDSQDPEAFQGYELQGPGDLTARTWIEAEGDKRYRIFAEVKGGVGQFPLAQRVVTKKPVLQALDVAHFTDGDLNTLDHVKVKRGNEPWKAIDDPTGTLLWVEVDRRGNIFGNHFPVLDGDHNSNIPSAVIGKMVAKNHNLVENAQIDYNFVASASRALDEDRELDLIDNNLVSGVVGGNDPQPPDPNAPTSFKIKARELADELSKDASLQVYSVNDKRWETIPVDFGDSTSGQFPGRPCSDGENVYLPVHKPGPDRLRVFSLEEKTWSDLPLPPSPTDASKPTSRLIDLEVDDDGLLYLQHGEEAVVELSIFDPQTGAWRQSPSPPLVLSDGAVKNDEESERWDNLEVGEDGSISVISRALTNPVSSWMDATKDQVMRFQKGQWETQSLDLRERARLATLSSGVEGRDLIHEAMPYGDPDAILQVGAEAGSARQTLKDPSGELADHFSIVTGAEKVEGQFRFVETAEF